MLEDFLNDFTAFGSLTFALFVVLLTSVLGVNELAMQLFVALVICYLINFPMKIIFFKDRPKSQKYRNVIEKFDAGSFPSLHSMRAVSFAIILSVFVDNPLFTLLMVILAGSVLYTRIALGKHYKVDVVVGTLLGFGVGLATIWWNLGSIF